MMTNEEIRSEVAKLCGWTNLKWRSNASRINKIDRLSGSHPDGGCRVPNYPEDLNACRKMEQVTIEPGNIEQYTGELYMVLERFWTCDRWLTFSRLMIDYAFAHASAHQRCEACLRTFDKWIDSPQNKISDPVRRAEPEGQAAE